MKVSESEIEGIKNKLLYIIRYSNNVKEVINCINELRKLGLLPEENIPEENFEVTLNLKPPNRE